MRTFLRAVLGCSVVAGALLAAPPAHADIVCTTAPNGGQVCYDNGSGGVAPGDGGVGGGGSDGIALPPPVPAAPAPYVPPAANVPPPAQPAPYVAPKAPVQQAPANVAPAPAPNQQVKGFAPAENPVIAGVPADAPAAEAAPTVTPDAVTSPATDTATVSATPSPSATATVAPIRSEPATATDNGTAPGFIAGSLGVLVVAAAIVFYRRKLRVDKDLPAK